MKATKVNQAVSYEVFLSYRHKPRDNRICKKAHTLLESFKPPRSKKQADIKRVFRDDAELPIAGVLSDTINEALKVARLLLVVCSTHTPESQWVDREVRTFIELGRSEKIFALLIDGNPQTSFPPSLKLIPGIEERTLDIRAHSERQSIKKMKKELLKVIAEATETPYEPLRISIKRRKFFRRTLAGAALFLLFLVSGFYSLYQWTTASYHYMHAQREEMIINDIIRSISFDLTQSVQSLPGASSVMVKILTDNIEYLDRLMEIGGASHETLREKANNYLNLARVYMMEGDVPNTLDTSRKAISLFKELEKNNPGLSSKNDLAVGYNLTGLFMQLLNEYERALDYLEKAEEVYKELEKAEPGGDYASSRAECLQNIAVCYYSLDEYENAADAFIKELAILKKINKDDASLENKILIADITSVAGSCLVEARNYIKGAQYNTEAVKLYEIIFKEAPDPQNYKSYVNALYALGINLTFLKEDRNAEYYLRLSIAEADKLVREWLPEFDPYYLSMYAMYDLLYDYESKLEEALFMSSQAGKARPGDTFVQCVYAYSLLFNGYYQEALTVLQALIDNNATTYDKLLADMDLFTLRGRETDDLLRLKDTLLKASKGK